MDNVITVDFKVKNVKGVITFTRYSLKTIPRSRKKATIERTKNGKYLLGLGYSTYRSGCLCCEYDDKNTAINIAIEYLDRLCFNEHKTTFNGQEDPGFIYRMKI